MPGLNERLASYTGEGRDQVSNYDKLAEMYGHSVAQRRAKEESWETEDQTSEVKLAVLQKMVAEQLEEKALADRLGMPVISKFEAYQIAKKANVETDERDAGIRMLSAMLKKHWAEDKSGDMVGETVMGLKKYFRANYPKSQVGEVFEIMAESGYSDMDVNSLARIAENIEDQESYEYEVRRAGLDSSSEKHKRARKVILSMVNSRQADSDVMVEKQTKPDFSPERQDVIGEEEEEDKENKEAQMMVRQPKSYDLLDLLRQHLDDTTILEELMQAMSDQEAIENLAHIIQNYDLGSMEEEEDLEDEEDVNVGII